MTVTEALDLLRRDPVKNAGPINFLTGYPVLRLMREGDSLLCQATSDHDWIYLCGGKQDELQRLLGLLTADDKYFAAIEDWILPHLTHGREIEWRLTVRQWHFPADAAAPRPALPVVALTPGTAPYIYEHSAYRSFTSPEYIADRIAKGPALGIVQRGTLAAWLLTHDDGAMGMLHVLPAYRRRGFARALTLAMIDRLRSAGRLPFVQIEGDNSASQGLAKELGFIADQVLSWVKLK